MSDKETKKELQSFLRRLRVKIDVFGIIYLDRRPKNIETLAALELTPKQRDEIIQNLTVEDYYKGPRKEDFHSDDAQMWEFGKQVNDEEVYIKITLGRTSSSAICISFHIAERPIQYPFKEE